MLTGLSTVEGVNLLLGWDGFLLTDFAWSGPFSVSLQRYYNNDFRVGSMGISGSNLANLGSMRMAC